MKKELREWGLILVKTIIVTLLVALGATLCDALSVPSWAACLGLLPAGYVFCKLAGVKVPSVRRWGPQLLGLMFFTFLYCMVLSHLEGIYVKGAAMLLLVTLSSFLWLIPEQHEKMQSKKEGGEPS
jgi:hypothetical protein